MLVVTGKVTESTSSALEAGWKAVPVAPGAMMVGHAEAVNQALQRIATKAPLTELMRLAEQQRANTDFWVTGGDTVIEFSGVPDANAVRMWSARAGAVTINGYTIQTGVSMEAAEVQQTGKWTWVESDRKTIPFFLR